MSPARGTTIVSSVANEAFNIQGRQNRGLWNSYIETEDIDVYTLECIHCHLEKAVADLRN